VNVVDLIFDVNQVGVSLVDVSLVASALTAAAVLAGFACLAAIVTPAGGRASSAH
jgi:hypothetical protein